MRSLEAFVANAPADYPVTYERVPGDGPLIECSVELGETFDNIDIDQARVVDRMRQEGISEDIIADTAIFFASKNSEHPKTALLGSHEVSGAYSPNDKTIVVFPGILCRKAVNKTRQMKSALTLISPQLSREVFANPQSHTEHYTESDIASVLYHEIRHQRHEENKPNIDDGYLRMLRLKLWGYYTSPFIATNIVYHSAAEVFDYEQPGVSIGVMFLGLLASHYALKKQQILNYQTVYWDRPSEVDARDAEKDITVPYPVKVRLRASNEY